MAIALAPLLNQGWFLTTTKKPQTLDWTSKAKTSAASQMMKRRVTGSSPRPCSYQSPNLSCTKGGAEAEPVLMELGKQRLPGRGRLGACELWHQGMAPAPPVDLLLQNRFIAPAVDEGRDEWRAA